MQNFSHLLNNIRQSHGRDEDDKLTVHKETAPRTIYIADLPKTVTYLEISEYFEQNVGSCMIKINR